MYFYNHLFYVSTLKYGCYMTDIPNMWHGHQSEQKQAMYKYCAISPAAKVYWEPTLMLDLEYRKLNTKNLLEYMKKHMPRDEADMWIYVSDNSPGLFDVIQLELSPENSFMTLPKSSYYSPHFQMNVRKPVCIEMSSFGRPR